MGMAGVWKQSASVEICSSASCGTYECFCCMYDMMGGSSEWAE